MAVPGIAAEVAALVRWLRPSQRRRSPRRAALKGHTCDIPLDVFGLRPSPPVVRVLWRDEIRSHHEMKPWLKPRFVGICRGVESFQGFLGGPGFRPSTVSASDMVRSSSSPFTTPLPAGAEVPPRRPRRGWPLED